MQSDYTDLWESVIRYMTEAGWRELTGKRRGFEQSLFDHCLVEVDVFLQMAPILAEPKRWNLNDRAIELVTVALMAHDVGKTLDEWQDYVHGRRSWLSDVNRGLTAETVSSLYTALGLEDAAPEINRIVENCINLHMRHERTAANVVTAILNAPPTSGDRWFSLAELVYHIDNLCSIGGFLGALDYLRDPRNPFAKHLDSAHHQVALRGVSSVMLHRAAQSAFEGLGWGPLLYFPEATIYIRSKSENPPLPSQDDIRSQLADVLSGSFGGNVAELVVGSPTATMLPKRELFDASEVREYLAVAGRRIGRQSFRKKPAEGRGAAKGRRQVVAEYLGVPVGEVDANALDLHTGRIADAQPEMVVFKFFKAATGPDFIGRDGASIAAKLYDDWLGQDAWTELQGMSTLMPARDMRHVDRFWNLPGSKLGAPTQTVEEIAPDRRLELLVQALAATLGRVYSELPAPPSRAALAADMASSFIVDLLAPASDRNAMELAREQLEAYAASKPFMGRVVSNARYLCGVCNAGFTSGTEARADFLEKPESHTNRAVSHGRFGKLVICNVCKHERLLRQLLLNARAQEVLVLFPRMMIGQDAGARLMARATDLYSLLYVRMMGNSDDPDTQISLGLTQQIAQKGMGRHLYSLSPAEVAELFSYRASEENRRKRRRELEKLLKDEYGEDLADANDEWGTSFESWEAAVDAVVADEVEDARDLRRAVYGLRPRLGLVCQTPNLVLMPLADPIGMRDESDTDGALRKVFVEVALALALDCAVAVVDDSQSFSLEDPEGVAWMPPVGPARRLLGDLLERLERRSSKGAGSRGGQRARLATADWVPLVHAERIFNAIGAASLVSRATNYSDRTDLYQVLSAPTVGHVVRRIEQASDGGQVAPYHLPALRKLEEVLA